MGFRQTYDINIQGRIIIDMMIYIMWEKKFSSYSLNAVSYEILGT